MSKTMIIVSMIIVARNAEDHILKSIQSLVRQRFNADEYEILIVDGMSDDTTVKIAKDYLKLHVKNYKIFSNKTMTLASGWNIALKNAHGKYVVRPDAHAELSESYVKTGIKKLVKDDKLIAVGGTLQARSETYIGGLISKILSNPIGVGASLFRIGVKEDTYSDTAVYAVYKKSIFKEVGYLNEELKRTQDIELHKRILDKGYLFLTSPDMRAIYNNRSTFIKFIKHAFKGGYWIGLSKLNNYRRMIPLLFLLFVISSFFIKNILFVLYPTYAFAVIFSFVYKSNEYNVFNLLLLLIMTFFYHLCYGFGTLVGKFQMTKNYIINILA